MYLGAVVGSRTFSNPVATASLINRDMEPADDSGSPNRFEFTLYTLRFAFCVLCSLLFRHFCFQFCNTRKRFVKVLRQNLYPLIGRNGNRLIISFQTILSKDIVLASTY